MGPWLTECRAGVGPSGEEAGEAAGEDQAVWEPEKELKVYPLKRSGFI